MYIYIYIYNIYICIYVYIYSTYLNKSYHTDRNAGGILLVCDGKDPNFENLKEVIIKHAFLLI
jgi:hypothetical protein